MRNILTLLTVAVLAVPFAAHAGSDGEHFGAIDTNRDNVISKDEAMAYHAMIFGKQDKNGNGKITEAEFAEYFKNKQHAWNMENGSVKNAPSKR